MSLTLYKTKKQSIIDNEAELTFGSFIKKLRSVWGPSRDFVSKDTEITASRLRALEEDNFSVYPEEEIAILARYYGIPRSLLHRKAKEISGPKKAQRIANITRRNTDSCTKKKAMVITLDINEAI